MNHHLLSSHTDRPHAASLNIPGKAPPLRYLPAREKVPEGQWHVMVRSFVGLPIRSVPLYASYSKGFCVGSHTAGFPARDAGRGSVGVEEFLDRGYVLLLVHQMALRTGHEKMLHQFMVYQKVWVN